jgi:Rieske Fe-S protein
MGNMRDPQGRLLHTHTAGKSKLNAYLDDYAFVIDGLLALHDATGDAKWLRAARQLQDDQLKMFRDEAGGAFFFTSHDHEELLARTKNCYDGVLPAGNSVSARNLLKLTARTGDKRYLSEARTIIELFASNLDQSPRGLTVLAQATAELLATEPAGQSGLAAPVNVSQAGVRKSEATESALVQVSNQKEEPPKKDEVVKAQAFLSVDRLPAGSACQVVVVLNVAKGWHINANPPEPENVIPVKVTWKSKNKIQLNDVKYPKGKAFRFDGTDEDVMVYEGEVQVRGTLEIPKDAGGLTEDMEIVINYQACNETGCLPPKNIKLTGKLPIAKQGETVKPINGKLFNAKVDPSR